MPAHTWHHGLVARWWAEFNRGGDDVEFFRAKIMESGEPALDAGCGTGRLLVPMRETGIDIDGSDAAKDMLDLCAAALEERGVSANLHHAAMHELAPTRDYQTVVVCGAFGIGGSRDDDLEGLRRLHACLRPGGKLFLDHYLPNFNKRSWESWIIKPELPLPYPSKEDRRTAADGTELELNSCVLDFDPLNQVTTREIRVRHYDGDDLIAEETYDITLNIYLKSEIELMLKTAGFKDVVVTGDLNDQPAQPWQDARIVFTATA